MHPFLFTGKDSTAMPKSISYAIWSLQTYALGMKLRALRTKKRLTLSRLAAETGLSTALLSKLETDRMIPTLPTLSTICRVYGVGLSYFFGEPESHKLSITRKAHLQGNARSSETARSIPLTAPGNGARMHAEMVEVTSAAPLALSEPNDETCGLIYVIEGKLQFSAGGMNEVLEAGDCAYIESTMALAWSTGGKQRCRILIVKPVATAGAA
jgi:transcriptional regulator with XRE-family HTH domain